MAYLLKKTVKDYSGIPTHCKPCRNNNHSLCVPTDTQFEVVCICKCRGRVSEKNIFISKLFKDFPSETGLTSNQNEAMVFRSYPSCREFIKKYKLAGFDAYFSAIQVKKEVSEKKQKLVGYIPFTG